MSPFVHVSFLFLLKEKKINEVSCLIVVAALMDDEMLSLRWKLWDVTAATLCPPGWRIWASTSICPTSWPAATALWTVWRTCGSWRSSMWVPAALTWTVRSVGGRMKLIIHKVNFTFFTEVQCIEERSWSHYMIIGGGRVTFGKPFSDVQKQTLHTNSKPY